jgi:hypothetical protein
MVDLRLYALTVPAIAGGRILIDLAACVADAATLVQLRHKNLDTRVLVEEVHALRAVLRPRSARELRSVVEYALKRRETS